MEIDEDAILASVDLSSSISCSSTNVGLSNNSVPSAASLPVVASSHSNNSIHFAPTLPIINNSNDSRVSTEHSMLSTVPIVDDGDDFFDNMVSSSRPFLSARETASSEIVATTSVSTVSRTEPQVEPGRRQFESSASKLTSSSISVPPNNSLTTSAKKDGVRQLKIDGYLKPMPVIIDPPTPIKEAAKRAKKSLELLNTGVQINNQNVTASYNSSTCDSSLVSSAMSSTVSSIEDVNENNMYPAVVNKEPYIFLKEVHDRWSELSRAKDTVHVKACIATLVSNLKVENKQWTLNICLNDGSAFLNAKIGSEFLNEMIGFSPSEMKKIKASGGPEARAKISEVRFKIITK